MSIKKLTNYCLISLFFFAACNKTYIYDKELTLEDGAICSARNCCSYIGKEKPLDKEPENE